MIEQTSMYRTEDGKFFLTEKEAMAHVAKAKFLERTKPFIASREWARGQDTRAANLIAEFLAFEEVA